MRTPSPAQKALDWVARAALVLGGAMIVVRLGKPGVALPGADPSDGYLSTGQSGRGRPSTPPSGRARAAETADMSGVTMARLLAVLGLIVVLAVFGMIGMLRLFEGVQQRDRPPLTAEQTTRIQPPAPNLQADPPRDLAQLRAHDSRLLETYGWTDAAHTRGHIPIDRAMSLLIGKPLYTPP